MSEHLTDVDQLPADWITLERAHQFLRDHLAVDGSDFIHRRWDCKYINARIDMRTGKVLLSPGNAHSVPCKGKNCGSTDPRLHSAECFEEYERTIGATVCATETTGEG